MREITEEKKKTKEIEKEIKKKLNSFSVRTKINHLTKLFLSNAFLRSFLN